MAMTGGTAKLVKTGYADYGDKDLPIKLYVYYKSTQNVSTNKSTIYVGMYLTTPSSSYAIGKWDDFNGSYVGKSSLTFNGTVPADTKGTYWLVENKSFEVSHNDDGTGKATIDWKWGVNSPWGQMVNPSGSFEITLPTIARASVPTLSATSAQMCADTLTIYTNRKSSSFTHTLGRKIGDNGEAIASGVGASYAWKVPDLASLINNKTSGTFTITCHTYNGSTHIGQNNVNVTLTVPSASVPTLSTSTITMGNSVTITTNRKSSNFTHKITYSFNGETGTIGTAVTGSVKWTVPLSLATKIKSATSGTGTITCVTYNGTATVGTKTVSFTATVPNNSTTQPSFTSSGFVLTPTGSIPSTFSGLYIQGKTGVKASFTASSSYADISKYTLTVENKSYTGNPATSNIIAQSGSLTATGKVTDSRGYYTSVPKTISVIPYSKPKVVPYDGERSIICARCTSDGTLDESGMYLKIKAGRSYSKVMSGSTQKNFCELGYRHKTASATSYSSDIPLITNNASSDNVEVILPGIVESLTTSYDVQLYVKDTMGERITTDTFYIPTQGTDFNLREGGDGAAFGKYAETANMLEVDWDVKFNKKVYIKDGKCISSTDWQDLGLSSNVSSSTYTYGRTSGCAYRVDNENHVYVSFNCKFHYSGGGILVNKTAIPEQYRPNRTVFAFCPMAGRNIARVFVNPSGSVFIEWVQDIASSTSTTSFQAEWIDGYLDYWL